MGNPFNRHWLMVGALWAVLGCIAGFLAVAYGAQSFAILAACCLAVLSFAAGWIAKKPSYFLIRGLFALFGVIWFIVRTAPILAEQPFSGRITGRICALPEETAFGTKTVLDDVWAEDENGWRKVNGRVTLLSDVAGAQYGDTILATATLEKPERRRNPGGWDGYTAALSQGVSLSGSAKKGEAEVAIAGGLTPLRGLYALRKAMEGAILSVNGEEAGRMLTGVLFGDVSNLDFETMDDFRLSGTAHVLAVSGLHVSALAGALMWVLGKIRKKRRGWGELFAVALALFCFCVMADFSVSVVRAALCSAFAFWRRLRGEQADVRLNLSFAALVQCAINPACVLSAGFALSYGAVLGIALLYAHFKKALIRLFPKKAVFEKAADLLAVSAAAQLGVLPASLYFFGMLPLLSMAWNILTVPITGTSVFLGLFGGLLGAVWSPLGAPFSMAAGGLCVLMRAIARIGGAISFSSVAVGGGSALVTLGLIIAAFGLSPFVQKKLIRISAFALCAALCVSAAVMRANAISGLVITMLDVGQGEAIVISCGGHTALLDGGNRNAYTDKGASVVLPYLRYQGIRALDAAIASHNDSDHAGGLLRVCQRMQVGGLLLSGIEGDEGFLELMDCAMQKRLYVQTLIPGDVLKLGDAELTVLHAKPGGTNEDSIVFLLKYGDFTALFTGDTGFEAEAAFADAAGEIDLLKVGHHGSKNSTSEKFLKKTRPRIAIISAGQGNVYGLPAPETVKRLNAAGAQVYTTAEQGAITIRVAKDGVFLSTMLP
ncbi:MAG: DNA internalization-related competence protein ComEC/Rec2 [Christensenellales bacterium]|jgi:competence protein ComEC